MAAVLICLVFVTSIGEGVMGALFAPFIVDALAAGVLLRRVSALRDVGAEPEPIG